MLTADLVAARRVKGELRITPLDPRARARAAELAADFLDIARDHVGRTRDEFEEAISAVEIAARERRLADGLRKLVEDRCEFDADEALDPEALRRALFLRAAEARRALADGASFDRAAVLEEVASAHGLTVDALERALYADLRGAHVLRAVRDASPAELAAGYDLAQAQAVLLRAVRVVAEVACAHPAAYRALFQKLKFLRLLHAIEPLAEGDHGGYRILIDGPFSLFESVTKYGLQLALALPAIAACTRWRIEADVRWGKEREPLLFRLAGENHPRADEDGDAGQAGERLADDVAQLLAALRTADSPWRVRPSSEILALPGAGLCVPDLVFEQPKARRRVYLEVMGYWSRDAVWRRVELVERGLPERILFAVGKHLRVSEQAIDDEAPSALYVYKRTMSAKAILEKVEALAARGATSTAAAKKGR